MVGFVVDIELSLTFDELNVLRKVADLQKCSVEQAARDCMLAKAKEVIQEELFERVDKKCNPLPENTERKSKTKESPQAPPQLLKLGTQSECPSAKQEA